MSGGSGHLLGISGIVHGSVWLTARSDVKSRVELLDGSTEGAALDSCCDWIQRIVVDLFSATNSIYRGCTQCRACQSK